MGLSPSKRVEEALRASPEFAAACDGAFARCRAEAAGAFPGVLPHQLQRAADLLHARLSASLPLVRRWASSPSPPSRARVDAALRRALRGASAAEARGLDRDEFGDFAAELFGAAVLAGAAGAAARGAIAGAGAAGRAGAGVVARAVGAYAAAVVVAVYVGLS